MKCLSSEGIITQVNKNSLNVEVKASSACSACENKSNCHVSSPSSKRNLEVFLEHPENYMIGEIVWVKSLQKNIYKAVLFAYLLPCIIMITAISLFVMIGISEALSVIFSLLLIVGYFGILSFYKAYFKKTISFFVEKKIL